MGISNNIFTLMHNHEVFIHMSLISHHYPCIIPISIPILPYLTLYQFHNYSPPITTLPPLLFFLHPFFLISITSLSFPFSYSFPILSFPQLHIFPIPSSDLILSQYPSTFPSLSPYLIPLTSYLKIPVSLAFSV